MRSKPKTWRLSSRILERHAGVDRKVYATFDQEVAKAAEKLMTGELPPGFADQLRQRKWTDRPDLGNALMTGQMAKQISPQEAEKSLKSTEAIIYSMTPKERRNPDILNASRRRRIARGSGMEVQDVNRLIKQYREAQKMFKTLKKTGGRGLPRLFGM
jgi:signal recognition particle subunit SRP54